MIKMNRAIRDIARGNSSVKASFRDDGYDFFVERIDPNEIDDIHIIFIPNIDESQAMTYAALMSLAWDIAQSGV